MNKEEKILEEISEALLNQEKVVFLFGAGTSISSGIPGIQTLKKNLWNNKLAPRNKEDVYNSLKKIGIEIGADEGINIKQITFEQLMTVACDLETGTTQEEKEKRIVEWLETLIPDIYKRKTKYFPSCAYEFVCHLINNGLVKYVISMNYDEILDKAIDDELGKGRCFKVVTLEDFELLRNTDKWEEIGDYFLIKPHGTISLPRSCRYRIDYVEKFEEDKRQVLMKVLENSILIILGYEVSDSDFRNLLADLGLNKIKKIIIVKNNPETVIQRLGGSNQICGYRGRDEKFFKELADALYGESSTLKEKYSRFYTKATRHLIRALIYKHVNPINKEKYSRFYTKATRHLIRALIYKHVNPINDERKRTQETIIEQDSLFFERLNLLIETLIYCFKVRGLFTRRALSSCPRIISALDDYVKKAREKRNPIEYQLQELEKEEIIKQKEISIFESWYFIPATEGKITKNLFENAAEKASEFLKQKLQEFFDTVSEEKKFVNQLRNLLARLPNDFDYDLLKDTSFYFLPFRNIELISRREHFRKRTEETLKMAQNDGTLYIISPSVAEWMWEWGKKLANLCSNINIIINKDVYEFLHFKHISKIVRALKETISGKGEIRAVKGVRYALTLAFKEANEKITGKAIFFLRDGKASAFSPIFIEENGASKEKSDIYKLKNFFDSMLKEGEKL